jgi:hypothetical protein
MARCQVVYGLSSGAGAAKQSFGDRSSKRLCDVLLFFGSVQCTLTDMDRDLFSAIQDVGCMLELNSSRNLVQVFAPTAPS